MHVSTTLQLPVSCERKPTQCTVQIASKFKLCTTTRLDYDQTFLQFTSLDGTETVIAQGFEPDAAARNVLAGRTKDTKGFETLYFAESLVIFFWGVIDLRNRRVKPNFGIECGVMWHFFNSQVENLKAKQQRKFFT